MAHRLDSPQNRSLYRPAPRRGPRMIPRRRGCAPGGDSRTRVCVAVSEKLVRMTEFGLQHAADGSSGWWGRVELEMQALVSAHLPPCASHVRMDLDRERLEIVLEYQLLREPRTPARERMAPGLR